MDRRTLLKLMGVAPAGVLAPTFRMSALAQAKPEQITVMTWGGLWGDALQKGVGELFTQETGVRVVQDRGSSPVQRVTKLKVSLDNQVFDLVQLHDGLFPLAESQGVLEKIDPNSPRLSNLSEIYPQFKHDYWIAQIYSAIGIAYNSEQVKNAPRSFADLWRPEFRGRIVLPEVSHSIGTYIIPIGALAAGKSPKDEEAGFEMFKKMVELEPIFAKDTDTIMNAFATGEAVAGLLYKSQTMTVQRRNPAVQWVFPEEGAIAISWGTGIAKNTPNREFAERFLNLTLDPRGQIEMTKAFNYPGTNRKTLDLLPPDERKQIEFTDAQRERLIDLDHQFMSDQRTAWVDRWNRAVAGR
jgi:putative spermidine/putrescine transport system substrate-binding protein